MGFAALNPSYALSTLTQNLVHSAAPTESELFAEIRRVAPGADALLSPELSTRAMFSLTARIYLAPSMSCIVWGTIGKPRGPSSSREG
jgi:hypothetical protein